MWPDLYGVLLSAKYSRLGSSNPTIDSVSLIQSMPGLLCFCNVDQGSAFGHSRLGKGTICITILNFVSIFNIKGVENTGYDIMSSK